MHRSQPMSPTGSFLLGMLIAAVWHREFWARDGKLYSAEKTPKTFWFGIGLPLGFKRLFRGDRIPGTVYDFSFGYW